jgi:hypothetical protein
MRAAILRAIKGSEIDKALPKRYFGIADSGVRRTEFLDILAFPDAHVVTFADLSRALKRLGTGRNLAIVAFMGDATAEARSLLSDIGARCFSLRAFGWTEERYAAIRQPKSHEQDRRKGGW